MVSRRKKKGLSNSKCGDKGFSKSIKIVRYRHVEVVKECRLMDVIGTFGTEGKAPGSRIIPEGSVILVIERR
jgi:hypothetical protein